MKIIPVDPVGTRPGGAGFVCRAGGEGGAVASMPDVDVYPPSRGSELRAVRLKLALSTRAAAALLDISGADLGRLERGEAILESDAAWDRAAATLVTD